MFPNYGICLISLYIFRNYKKSSVSYYIFLFFLSSANIILQENESGRAGLKSDLTITCSACDESISFQTSTNVTKRGKSFDVNKRAVYHSLESGTGYEGLASFCGIMNMPCMSTSAYQKQVDSILEVVEDYTKEKLTQAGQRLRNIVLDENPDLDKDKDDDCLPEVFLELLRPTFMTLSDTKLFERCIRGTTQNPNECINGTVWVRCPKHKHHGAKVVRYAAASAICHFHKGAECRNEIMDKLSIPGGSHTTHSFRLKNNQRLRKANAQATAMEKKLRQGLQLVRTRREEALLEIDGPSYDPGGF